MPLIGNWHLDCISDHLEAVTRCQIQKLVINVPPGHAKSLLVSVLWPAWIWASNPTWRGIFSAYHSDLAIRDSVKCRTLIESDWYQENYSRPSKWALSVDSNRKDAFQNTASGSRMSLSVGGKATGYRGDCIVVDDPINAKEASSKLARDESILWWDKVMSSRLNDLARGSKVIIMQRLHEEDLSGHVLSQGGYEHLCLPSEFDPARRSRTFYVRNPVERGGPGEASKPELFWEDPRTTRDELLFPALFPEAVIKQAKIDLGSDGFAGQHDQSPVADGGSIFQAHWWQRWDGENKRGPFAVSAYDSWAASLDCAFKETATSDFVVCQVWARARANRYLIWQYRGRIDMVGTVALVQRVKQMFPQICAFYVEDKANGSAVISTLRGKVEGLIAVNPDGGKESRARAVSPLVEAGNVFIPHEGRGGWEGPERDGDPVKAFMHEHKTFPFSKHDDQVDCTTQLLNQWKQGEIHIMSLPPVRDRGRGVTM